MGTCHCMHVSPPLPPLKLGNSPKIGKNNTNKTNHKKNG